MCFKHYTDVKTYFTLVSILKNSNENLSPSCMFKVMIFLAARGAMGAVGRKDPDVSIKQKPVVN